MQCDRAQEFFSDYLERTLDRPMTVALEAHLAGCADCREEIEALQTTFYALEAVPEVEPPADGAWQVMAKIRNQRADQLEAEREHERTPSFLEWLRALNPFSAAMGASLATLVIGGTLFATGIVPHIQLNLLPTRPAAVTPQPDSAPTTVQVTYGSRSATDQIVDVSVTPSTDLPDGEAEVMGGGLLQTKTTGPFRAGAPIPFRLRLPVTATSQALWVMIRSPKLDRENRFLVVLPVGQRQAPPVNLVFAGETLEQGLIRLAPYLDRAVVVDNDVNGNVSLQADHTTVRGCLSNLASQAGGTLREEGGIYHLSAQ